MVRSTLYLATISALLSTALSSIIPREDCHSPTVTVTVTVTAPNSAGSTTPTPSTASISPPKGCPVPTWTVTNFRWFNGTDSLDCIHSEEDKNAKGCMCGRSWCEPDPATCNGTMVGICWTGMPNYEPWGYGPMETLDIGFEDGLTCHDEYIGYRIKDIGNGESQCGYADRGAGRIVSFYGTSNDETSTGHMDYVLGSGHALTCSNGSKITYSGSTDFQLNCVHDSFFNATCTAKPFEIPVLSWWWV